MVCHCDNSSAGAVRRPARAHDDPGLGPSARDVHLFILPGAEQPAADSAGAAAALSGSGAQLHSSSTTAQLLPGQRVKHGVNTVSALRRVCYVCGTA